MSSLPIELVLKVEEHCYYYQCSSQDYDYSHDELQCMNELGQLYFYSQPSLFKVLLRVLQ